MNVQTLRITGMTCDHCAKSIEELAGMAGVVEAQVSYDEGTARIKTEAGVDSAKLIDVVQ
ncbi:MAG: cation transporter, partial [Gammaproteobacteria bacterium]